MYEHLSATKNRKQVTLAKDDGLQLVCLNIRILSLLFALYSEYSIIEVGSGEKEPHISSVVDSIGVA